MTRTIGVLSLVVGTVILAVGVTRTDALGERARHFVTGEWSDKTMLLLAAGAAAAIVGLVAILSGRGSRA